MVRCTTLPICESSRITLEVLAVSFCQDAPLWRGGIGSWEDVLDRR